MYSQIFKTWILGVIMVKVFAISDLHLSFSSDKPMDVFGVVWENYFEKIVEDWQNKVGENDVVLLAGDLSWAMSLENAAVDIAQLAKLKGKKVIIKGNHDYWWSSYAKVKSLIKDTQIIALQNNAVRFDGVVVCGTRGWTICTENSLVEDKKIYDRELIRMELSLKEAQKLMQEGDKLIAMIHYPPLENGMEESGFTRLFSQYGVDKVVYGHIHGKSRAIMQYNVDGIDYLLTSCDKLGNRLFNIY